MSGQDLYAKRLEYLQASFDALSEFKQSGRKLAYCEAKYRKEKAVEIATLRSEGYPVTIITELANGAVADERLDRDLAQVDYEAAREALWLYKLALRITDEDIKREWSA